jgi:competence protein ComEA
VRVNFLVLDVAFSILIRGCHGGGLNHPGRCLDPRKEKIMNILQKTLVAALVCFAFGNANAEVIDINSADADSIAANVTGIGPAKAEAIVAYRKANGAFESVDDLMLVKGIGGTTLDKIRDNLTVNKPQ